MTISTFWSLNANRAVFTGNSNGICLTVSARLTLNSDFTVLAVDGNFFAVFTIDSDFTVLAILSSFTNGNVILQGIDNLLTIACNSKTVTCIETKSVFCNVAQFHIKFVGICIIFDIYIKALVCLVQLTAIDSVFAGTRYIASFYILDNCTIITAF